MICGKYHHKQRTDADSSGDVNNICFKNKAEKSRNNNEQTGSFADNSNFKFRNSEIRIFFSNRVCKIFFFVYDKNFE